LAVIPTLILFGLVFGRWWRSSLIVAAVGWPVLLLATDVIGVGPALLGASGLAIANTAVGVLVHQVILRLSRRLRVPKGEATPSRPG
jgi:hypothetical protein